MNWGHIDRQIIPFSPRLRDDLGISPPDSNSLASTIAREVQALSAEARAAVLRASPVGLLPRLDELRAFQSWMDIASSFASQHPGISRAQVITQNYVCFVYLGEPCFIALREALPASSVTHKVCKFLTRNPVLAFRNALAHANWRYKEDFSGIEYWARKGPQATELAQWEVSQLDLNFWQALSRCIAYVAFTIITDDPTANDRNA